MSDQWEAGSSLPARRLLYRCKALRPGSDDLAPLFPRRADAKRAGPRKNRSFAVVHILAGPPFSTGTPQAIGKSRSGKNVVVSWKFLDSSSSEVDLVNALGAHLFKKFPRAVEIERCVGRFDAEKETVAARQLKAVDGKHRMIGHP